MKTSPTRSIDADCLQDLSTAVDDAAADWIARRDAGLSPTDEAEFHAWLSADPLNAQAFFQASAAWAALNAPFAAGRGDAVLRDAEARSARRKQRRHLTLVSVGLAAAAALVVALFIRPSASVSVAAAPTFVVRPDRQTLPDGSTVDLNAGAEIAVSYTAEKRGVRLIRGEGLFSVVKDRDHPFVVTAGEIQIRAVGTAFVVRHEATEVRVMVTEGRVAVDRGTQAIREPSATSATTLFLDAGGHVTVPTVVNGPPPAALAVQPLTKVEMAEALAWRDHRVEFTFTSLGEAAALFNGQNALRLILADDATAGLKISGVFWTDDPEGFARLLETSLGLTASRRSEGEIFLRR